ncbi:MAG: HigA family addiction module antitoxin [Tepidisphaeraceae bacterium]|jgi:addiction module HigA family antidote
MLKSPFHPGMYLRQLLDEHGITQTRLARHIGVQIGVINQICNEKRGISPAMALKLSHALRTTPQFWLNLENAYNLGGTQLKRPIRPLIRVA